MQSWQGPSLMDFPNVCSELGGKLQGMRRLPGASIFPSCFGHVDSPVVGATCALSSTNFSNCTEKFTALLLSWQKWSWDSGEWQRSCFPPALAPQLCKVLHVHLFPPCVALLPPWGSWPVPYLCSLLGCTLITVLQAGVSHAVNPASREIQTTHRITLLYSKTPGNPPEKMYLDVEKEYWFVRYRIKSESRQPVFSWLSRWEPVCLPQTWTEPKHWVTEQFKYLPAFVLLNCFAKLLCSPQPKLITIKGLIN